MVGDHDRRLEQIAITKHVEGHLEGRPRAEKRNELLWQGFA